MKAAPAGLAQLLLTGQFVFADLYTFTLITGQVLTYTSADADVVIAQTTNPGIIQNGNTFSSLWAFTNCSATANSGISPDGTNDAWLLQRSSTAGAFIEQDNTITALTTPTTFKFSICAKPVTGNFIGMYMSTEIGDPNADRACFNIANGTISLPGKANPGTTLTNVTASIQPVGNGFYRCSVSATFPVGATKVRCSASTRSTSGQIDGTDPTSNCSALIFSALVEIVTGAQTTYSSSLFFDQSGNKAVGHWKTGLDTDTWQVYVMPVEFDPVTGASNPILIGNTSWLQAVAAGALAGAQVDIDRIYWTSWPQPWTSPLLAQVDWTGAPLKITDYFAGRVAAVDVMRNQAVISINSWLDQFKLMMPRNLWQSACRHTLFDAGCTLNQALFASSSSAQSGSTQAQIVTTGLGQPSGYYTLGQITMTSGKNSGFRRMVKSFDGTNVNLIAAFPFTISPGDGFTVYPGCDKTLQTCTNKFKNNANFGGEDLIPKPETAV